MEFSDYPSFRSKNFSATNLVMTGPGILHTVCIGSSGAVSAANTLVIYDNTTNSGNVIFYAPQIAGVASKTNNGCAVLDVAVQDGIYAVVGGSVDATVTFVPTEQNTKY